VFVRVQPRFVCCSFGSGGRTISNLSLHSVEAIINLRVFLPQYILSEAARIIQNGVGELKLFSPLMIVGEYLSGEHREGDVRSFEAPSWTQTPLSPLHPRCVSPIWLTVSALPAQPGAFEEGTPLTALSCNVLP
jgi:hypothetical protein